RSIARGHLPPDLRHRRLVLAPRSRVLLSGGDRHLPHPERQQPLPRAAPPVALFVFHLPRELTTMTELTGKIVLGPHRYGKAENRVVRIVRDTDRREIRDLKVSSFLHGDFDAAQLHGTQSTVLTPHSHQQPRD